jgi:hypothetical protein
MHSVGHSISRKTSYLLIVAALAMSCAKERAVEFVQGQGGSDLEQIENYDNKFYDLKTGAAIAGSDTTRAEAGVRVGDSVRKQNHLRVGGDLYNNLSIVRFETSEPKKLIGSVPFRGNENDASSYKLLYRITEKYLKIYKVAAKEALPSDEHFYIEETLADGRVIIPIVSYAVKGFFRVEKQRNGDDEETHRLIEIPESDRSKATHARIDFNSKEVFEPVQKVDLFPKDLFKGAWYYAETIIEAPLKATDEVGSNLNVYREGPGLVPAAKICFVQREKQLVVVNVARDDRLSNRIRDVRSGRSIRAAALPDADLCANIQKASTLRQETVLSIPSEAKSFRLKSLGNDIAIKDEERKDISWMNRSHLALDLTKLYSSTLSIQGSYGEDIRFRVLDIEVDTNYFGFTVMATEGLDDASARRVKYSFVREAGRAEYPARKYTREDRQKFGFFTAEKPFIPDYEYYSEQDFQKQIYLSRFNPTSGKIVFHFTNNSPEWLKETGKLAVEAWNEAFKEAFIDSPNKLEIVLGENTVPLGDLRYNTINFIEELTAGNLFGFGPSVADPTTGEIVSATSNVHIESIRGAAVSGIRSYLIQRAEGRLAPVAIAPVSPSSVGAAEKRLKQGDFGKLVEPILSGASLEEILKIDAEESRTIGRTETRAKLLESAKKEAFRCAFSEGVDRDDFTREIEKSCPAVVSLGDFLAAQKKDEIQADQLTGENFSAIDVCAAFLTKSKTLATLIHEMGHNFGLRHNFRASTDKGNFPTVRHVHSDGTTTDEVVHSSSTMEYTEFSEDRLTTTGPYDVAAIRYGYANQVELKDGEVIDVDPSLGIAGSVKGKELRPYLFCTDEDAWLGNDGLCKMHDTGTTYLEVVKNRIKSYADSQFISRYRRGVQSYISDESLARFALGYTFAPLRSIYDDYRFLLAELTGFEKSYFEQMSAESETNLLKGLAAAQDRDPRVKTLVQDLYPASRQVVNFLLGVAFENDYYCVVEKASGEKVPMSFLALKEKIFNESGAKVNIRRCEDLKTSDLLALAVPGAKALVGSFGTPHNNIQYQTPIEVDDAFKQDVIGTRMAKSAAMWALTSRSRSGARNQLKEFVPSPMDESSIREVTIDAFLRRLLKGIYLPEDKKREKPFPRFEREADSLGSFLPSIVAGLQVPMKKGGGQNIPVTRERMMMFTTYAPSPAEEKDVANLPGLVSEQGRTLYVAPQGEANAATVAMFNAYNVAREKITVAAGVSDNLTAQVATIIAKNLPTRADAAKMKVAEYLSTLNLWSQLSTSVVPAFMGCVREKLPEAFKDYEEISAKLAQALQEASTDQASYDAFRELPVEALLVKVLGREVQNPMVRENFAAWNTEAGACAKVINEAAAKVRDDVDELKAQQNLIRSVLSGLSGIAER